MYTKLHQFRQSLAIVIIFISYKISITEAAWKTVWIEQFNGPSGSQPSGGVWKYDLGTSYPGGPANWGTGEVQTYTNSTTNINLDGNGFLRIIPLKDNGSGQWTSARIETQRSDFKAPSGGMLAIQAKIQMPNVNGDRALGYWPAFWALGAPIRNNYYSWPGIGEYDIMENVNGINKVWGTLHCGVSPGGPCRETNGLGNNVPCPGQSCQSAFHEYTFIWDDGRKEFRWYVDGQQFHTVTAQQIGENTWNQLTEHGYFILLNVAMGGGFPNGVQGSNTPTASTVPGYPMIVDYVGVFST